MTPTPDIDPYATLAPAMQQWVWRQGWHDLRPIQRDAIAPIAERKADVIVSASTAGGKTEAAFLPILTNMLEHGAKANGFGVMMVSPLKALINDQTRRLEDMTSGTDIAVHAWHGDVAQSRKQAAQRHPSGVLLITPESLEAMLALRPAWVKEAMGGLRYIVVDELHAFMGSERGKQLQSLLTRLQQLTGADAPRIALSATIKSTADAALFLRPDGSRPSVAITDSVGANARISLKEYIATDRIDPKEAITEEIYQRLRGSNNLIFTNSRKDAEAYMVSLDAMCDANHVPSEFAIHHGSLSRDDRQAVEHQLQRGQRPTTAICTASMELGVDIGSVASVAQIGTAVSPSILRQRLGRSGRRGEPATLRIFSVDEQRDDYKFHLRANLVQNIAVVDMMARGQFDPNPPADAFLSITVQQLLSMLSEHGSFYAHEAYDMLCAKGAFGMLSQADFASLLRYLGEKKVISQLATGQLVIGTAGERLLASRDFFSAFTTPPDYTIVDRATQRTIGAVQYKPYYGEIFILAGQKWIVDAVEERSSTVTVSHTGSTGKMMFEGTGINVSADVTRRMREIYTSSDTYPWLDVNTGTPQQLQMAREWFARHSLDQSPWLAQSSGLSFFTWAGMNANRAIALMASTTLGLSLQYDHLAVSGLSPESVDALAAQYAHGDAYEIGEQLAAAVPRVKKERGKFDQFIPDTLLNRQYAATKLDVASALTALTAK